MPAPDSIRDLVQRFGEHAAEYHSGAYNETQLRREFLDPFFEALGWDVTNRQGYAEPYKDVVHEDAIKISGAAKAPDYAFRIGGARKFFVEAKKPSVNLRDDIPACYQLRRYAWSAKLPLSILTDFSEFAVYDCRGKPDKNDKSSTGRLMYFTYDQYIEKWDLIAGIFSPEAIRKGSFDRYAETVHGKHGTADVDDAFLAEIERWRDLLARNIALRNPHITQRALNYAVQMTIDRIIFLRICEDRGIEFYGQLQALTNGGEIYARMGQLFRKADERYNSGLFHFRVEKGQNDSPDNLTLGLTIDDKPLKDILTNLYYPESPYEFSVVPADILGQVYEQFLGKVIRLTDGHRAVVEAKPEVKKAGGVYYTPTYIVAYIVRHTLGSLLEGKRPGEKGVGKGAPLRVLDPACGSGSFLLGAYQYLLDWYRDGYSAEAEKWAKGRRPTLYQGAGGEWKLTTAERKRILLDHIYGVDIDPQAVEVTKLSLLLKVLEGENEQTLAKQLSFWQERALPNLGQNIQCGNSLIGTDFNAGQQMGLLDEEQQTRINAFDWADGFPQVFPQGEPGGFDVVIGNPPYVRQESLGKDKAYFQRNYQVYHGMADLYAFFIERGLRLLRPGGRFGYIVANKWMRANYGEPLRRWLKTQQIIELTDFGDLPVFETATTYPCILVLSNQPQKQAVQVTQVKTLDFVNLESYVQENSYLLAADHLTDNGWSLAPAGQQALLDKLRKAGTPLGEYVQGKIYRGVLTGLNDAFVIDAPTRQRLIEADPRSAEVIKPFLAGRDVKRYQPAPVGRFLILIPRGWTRQQMKKTNENISAARAWTWLQKAYPAIARHLLPFAEAAEKRCDKGEYWWELRACVYYAEFEKSKMLLPDISLRGNFILDNKGGVYCVNTAYIIGSADTYLLGILNSLLITFFYQQLSSSYRGGYLRFIYQYIEQLPIRSINFSDPAESQRHARMVELVERMLGLHQKLATAQTPAERTTLQRQITATDREIDALVYELYGLTDEEIAIVEGS